MAIVLCKQDLVLRYQLGVITALNELGHPEALVTDESTIGDFFALGYDESEDEECRGVCRELSKLAYGHHVDHNTYLWEVGKWIEGER